MRYTCVPQPGVEGPGTVTAVEPASATRVAHRICPLCEATCGLRLTLNDGRVDDLRGDPDHVLSHGYVCPKAIGLVAVDDDPDRVRTPLVRRDGEQVEASWEEAFAEADGLLRGVAERHGRNAVAIYAGNPNVHNLAGLLYLPVLIRALGTRNVYSASTVDQMPKQVSAGLMFGTMLSIPIPDVDRTQMLVVIGANPLESNGSLMTAPDMRGRLRRLRERGGRLVVVDPRRTRTAEIADQHIAITPGTDALLLAAVAQVILAEGLTCTRQLDPHLAGMERLPAALAPFTPETVAPVCRVSPEVIRGLARDLAAAPSAAVYGRIGTTAQEFGTLASWLVDVVNVLTGNLDREGGAMFTRAAAGARNTTGEPGRGRGLALGRWRSRVRGAAEAGGELPAACLAEEIDTPGEGQVHGLVVVAGNPALSLPNGARLGRALASLEALVCVDVYRNETTRHAHVLLPVPGALQRAHYDLAFTQLSVRDYACYSPAVLPRDPGQPDDWEILLRLAGIAMGMGPAADLGALDDLVAHTLVEREVATAHSPVQGRGVDEVLALLAPRRGPERLLDLMLRCGPHGDGFGARPDGLSLALLEDRPHGVDLGPLRPRLPEVLRTPSGKVEVAPEPILADLERLRASLERRRDTLVLVGRRDLRSNNSWMHNVPVLVRGPERCTLHLHPEDALRCDVRDGDTVVVRSRVGEVRLTAEVTDRVLPGVVSIPHGWGHDDPGTRLSVASARPGVNVNVLVDDSVLDPLSGTAALNGVPVTVQPADAG